jgi:hypothetical protein
MQEGAFPYISQLSLLPARLHKRTSASSISSGPPVIHHGIRSGGTRCPLVLLARTPRN